MTFYEEQRYKAWFEYAEPGLLTNRTIRNYLNRYSTEKWPDAVKLTLLYGIVALRQSLGGEVYVPLEELRRKISQSEAAYCIEEKLPPIQEKMHDLKDNVQEILEAFSDVKVQPQNSTPNVPLDKIESVPEAKGIYPEWWGDGSNNNNEKEEKEVPKKTATEGRPPPRLCYSMPVNQQSRDLVEDIVQPKYHMLPQQEKSPQELRSVANIAESFLKNRWTSGFCNKPFLEHSNEDTGQSRDLDVQSEAVKEDGNEALSYATKNESFWVDFTPENKRKRSPIKLPHRGIVLDFGHLTSPRFPPDRKKSAGRQPTTPRIDSEERLGSFVLNSSTVSSSSSDLGSFDMDSYNFQSSATS